MQSAHCESSINFKIYEGVEVVEILLFSFQGLFTLFFSHFSHIFNISLPKKTHEIDRHGPRFATLDLASIFTESEMD